MFSNKSLNWVASTAALFALADVSVADVPFYYAAATAVDAQIKSLVVGVNEAVGQAVVSHDRKYVTLQIDPRLSSSLGVRNFTYQKPGLGFVGSAAASNSTAPRPISDAIQSQANPNTMTPSIAALPSQLNAATSPLEKSGIFLVRPLP